MVVALANAALVLLYLSIAFFAVRALRIHRRRLQRRARRALAVLAEQPLLAAQTPSRHPAQWERYDEDLAA
ncbi:MAG: hypothetical protein FJ053_09870 [Cyanobacteria bacterium M_surface_10_m1_298]|nr:hypothetical protein [Cyanobacteria bacterium M_surface_10_m1_298]